MTPYIHFQGNCREAMTAYQSIFGGKLDVMVYGDMPGGEPRHVGSTAVMHSALMTDEVGDLQGSDFPPGVEGDALHYQSRNYARDPSQRSPEPRHDRSTLWARPDDDPRRDTRINGGWPCATLALRLRG
jgi:hypothetical protein